MAINRYFIKQVAIYAVYDRMTGMLVGETLVASETARRVLRPKGLSLDEKVEDSVVKIHLGSEDAYHKAFVELRYKPKDDKLFEEKTAVIS